MILLLEPPSSILYGFATPILVRLVLHMQQLAPHECLFRFQPHMVCRGFGPFDLIETGFSLGGLGRQELLDFALAWQLDQASPTDMHSGGKGKAKRQGSATSSHHRAAWTSCRHRQGQGHGNVALLCPLWPAALEGASPDS